MWKAKFYGAFVAMPVPHHFHTGAWHDRGRRARRGLVCRAARGAGRGAGRARRLAAGAGRGPARGHAPGPRSAQAGRASTKAGKPD